MKLVADRCLLRPPTADDADSIARHVGNRAVSVNLRDRVPYPYTLADAVRWIGSSQAQDPVTSFIIDVAGAAVGGIGLVLGTDIERISAELGYWLGEEYWGRGIATVAIRRICEYGFGELGLVRIFALPMGHNVASHRVLEKAGFIREGILRNACIKDGKILDEIMYAKIKGEMA
jgi:RimJ/RimL family protein N-acetyltransferase